MVEYASEGAREAEGTIKGSKILEIGIRNALADDSLAKYWILVNEPGEPVGSISVLEEWSDWNVIPFKSSIAQMRALKVGRKTRQNISN